MDVPARHRRRRHGREIGRCRQVTGISLLPVAAGMHRWRTFVYGWKPGGTKLLPSGYPTAGSRVMSDRDIPRRVRKPAPDPRLDRDPYVVVHEGRVQGGRVMSWRIAGAHFSVCAIRAPEGGVHERKTSR